MGTSGSNTKSYLGIRPDKIKSICKEILEKHLDGRKFIKDKVKKWGELIIYDTEEALKKKYPEYAYGIFFYISEITAYNSHEQAIDYNKTDIITLQVYNNMNFIQKLGFLK